MYVYVQTESKLWTVGFYQPDGNFHAESDHTNPSGAAKRVAYLNGHQPTPFGVFSQL